jgi:hypothetical protein
LSPAVAAAAAFRLRGVERVVLGIHVDVCDTHPVDLEQ